MKTITQTTTLLFLLFVQGLVFGQSRPELLVRFTNPTFDESQRTYSVDVEMKAKEGSQDLFGMNLRFFYDASQLEFLSINDFAQGYGFPVEAPKAYVGSASSGVQLLGLDNAAGYVNGAVQLIDEDFPMALTPDKWQKVFQANFKVPVYLLDETDFCPSLVWDQKPYTGAGGMLQGSEGLLITVKENNRNTRQETAPTIVTGEPLNWKYNKLEGLPYGRQASDVCITLTQTVSTDEPDASDEKEGYVLFQNTPNPFDVMTTVEFIVPFTQDAKLNLYDNQGKLVEVIKGHYTAGRNKVQVEYKPWMETSSVIYYQLEAEDGTTLLRKMTIVTR